MFLLKLLLQLLRFLLFYITSHNRLIPKTALIWQENQYYKRYFSQHNIHQPFELHEKWFIHNLYSHCKNPHKYFSLLSPQTILYSCKRLLSDFWNNTHKVHRKKGRPRITAKTKKLILSLKNENYLWGVLRIQMELSKLSIDVSRETIRKVISDYRKEGLIKPNLSWKKFLTAHWKSLFACDFLTVDIFGFKRLYVFFIIQLHTTKIVEYSITSHPDIRFLRNRFAFFSENYPNTHLIHNNSGELKWFPWSQYSITDIPTVPYSPNMNAFAERFVRSIRSECLDWFIIFTENQLRNIVKEYVTYYNSYRPHQGIGKIPDGKPPDKSGAICSKPVLFGLHHHYFRDAG